MKPFNLEEALAGKAVKLRNGEKAYVRHHETVLSVVNDWQLQGIKEDGDLIAWNLDGSNSFEYAGDEIIGMYPETRTINGFEVPAPETSAPASMQACFIANPLCSSFCSETAWEGAEFEACFLKRGLVFLNAEDAIANAKAMLGINPYEGGDE